MYLQINMVKYDADREIMNSYENLQTVWSQFFTDMLLFVYIRSTSNIHWFIGIRICCQEYQRRAIQSLSTIRNIRSAIWWAIPKVILNYSHIPSLSFPSWFLDLIVETQQLFNMGKKWAGEVSTKLFTIILRSFLRQGCLNDKKLT